MIVVDSSALIAILTNEPERSTFEMAIASTSTRLICSVNYQESAQIMYSRHGEPGVATLDRYLDLISAEIVPFTREMAAIAVQAFKSFGKGMNTKAKLNMANCAAYALAKLLDAPLLFKGGDFAHTDVKQLP